MQVSGSEPDLLQVLNPRDLVVVMGCLAILNNDNDSDNRWVNVLLGAELDSTVDGSVQNYSSSGAIVWDQIGVAIDNAGSVAEARR